MVEPTHSYSTYKTPSGVSTLNYDILYHDLQTIYNGEDKNFRYINHDTIRYTERTDELQ